MPGHDSGDGDGEMTEAVRVERAHRLAVGYVPAELVEAELMAAMRRLAADAEFVALCATLRAGREQKERERALARGGLHDAIHEPAGEDELWDQDWA